MKSSGEDDNRRAVGVFLPIYGLPVVFFGVMLDGGIPAGGCKTGIVRVWAVHGEGCTAGLKLRRGGGATGIGLHRGGDAALGRKFEGQGI